MTVLVHSGVFVPRQYATFAGIVHGQKVRDFLRRLVGRGYATVITPGALHRGRLFHVQYRPLYEAIGEPHNRNRKPAAIGRLVERLMVLDALLGDTTYTWLGTEHDKLNYFIFDALKRDFRKDDYPHIVFGQGDDHTVRYFPDKFPIGVNRHGGWDHVFVYLVTRTNPADFRLFLHRHAHLLRALDRWTIRVLVPIGFRKAARVYRQAARDVLMRRLTPSELDELDWFFRARLGRTCEPAPDRDLTLQVAAQRFAAPRFRALRRVWEHEGKTGLWMHINDTLANKVARGQGRVEFVELRRQYLHLAGLVGCSDRAERGTAAGPTHAKAAFQGHAIPAVMADAQGGAMPDTT